MRIDQKRVKTVITFKSFKLQFRKMRMGGNLAHRTFRKLSRRYKDIGFLKNILRFLLWGA